MTRSCIALVTIALGAGNGVSDTSCFDQPPNRGGIYSDQECDSCSFFGATQLVAEDFTLDMTQSISLVRFWGGYNPGNTPPEEDRFTVAWWDDAGSLPGNLITRSFPAPVSRMATGGEVLPGVDRYEFTIVIDPPLVLEAGTYWLQVHNDTNECPWDCQPFEIKTDGDVGIADFLTLLGQWGTLGSSCDFGLGEVGVGVGEFLALLGHWGACPSVDSGDWFWEFSPIAVNGVMGSGVSLEGNADESWIFNPFDDLATDIQCTPVASGSPEATSSEPRGADMGE